MNVGIDEKVAFEKAERIISAKVESFLRRIHDLSDIGPFRKYRKLTPIFSIFEPASEEYYEYCYFEGALRRFIREELVNVIIPELLELYGYECLVPDTSGTHYVGFSIEDLEDIYPFEFIVRQGRKSIGYRYTNPCWEDKELKRMLKSYAVNQIRIIDWSLAEADSISRKQLNISEKQRTVVAYISARDFFESYFPVEVYELFLKRIKVAVAEANKDIGFSTIPRLSLSYLSKFKAGFVRSFSEFRFNELVFEETGRSTPIRNLLSVQDYSNLDERFINQELYRGLIGQEKFAVSFITSEYMYQILKSGGRFDYTSVVCGYIKSIEQLLYKMLQITLDNLNGRKLMIKPANPFDENIKDIRIKNPKNKKSWLIPFEREYEQYFDVSLGSMIWFVNDNESGWYLSRDGKNTVRRYLLNFSKEDRNEHFHKDNIDDLDEVRRIRNNTFALLYYLIGGYKLTNDPNTDKDLLGICDDTFDRMYLALADVPKGRLFYLQFQGEEEIAAYCPYEQERPRYDSNGSLRESTVCFVKHRPNVDYIDLMTHRTKEDEIIVDCNHMPERIWLSLGAGRRRLIEW